MTTDIEWGINHPECQRPLNRVTLAEAKLYMFLQENRWRFPTHDELYAKYENDHFEVYESTWDARDIERGLSGSSLYIIPVRDVDK
jgi:hypothetical protein